MKIAVLGEMNEEIEYSVVKAVLDQVDIDNEGMVFTVLSGGTKGVDTLARTWADERKVDFVLLKPSFMLDPKHRDHNPRDFWIRDKQLVDNSDAVIIIGSESCDRCARVQKHAEYRRKNVIRAVL